MSRELIIPFESFNDRGIQKRIISNVEKSFFYNIYMQAFQLIEQINKTNDIKVNKGSTECCNNLQNRLNDFQNVIAFTGRRGTGKTSSMLSFMDTLVKGEFKDEYFKKESFNFMDKGFYAIPYTDASLMSKNEDIFEIVLSKMLLCVKNEYNKDINYRCCGNDELKIKKIDEKICEIYNDYSSLKNSKDFAASAPYNFMEKLAEKHNVREKFIELVKEFTDTLNNFYDKRIDYLIICIDDIDMTQNKHMDIMQCVHQYFMIPRVIVLVSFNIPMLTATLQANFYSNVSIQNSRDEEHNHQLQMTRNQTYDFMRKIIPADMRINMPSWKKKDYRELFPIQIDFNEKETIEKLFAGISKCDFYNKIKENNEKLVTPKELIMLMLADRTSIYLDICGYKLHFMQPDSLRELSDLFYLIYNMKFCNDNKKNDDYNIKNEDCQKRRENRKILLDYLHFKMLPENNFSSEIDDFINDFLSSPMERRGRIIWDYCFKLLIADENNNRINKIYGDVFYNKETERFKAEKYSLGSLYRVLYSATRLNNLDRKVVVFLLASFSFSIPQFVEDEKMKKKSDENYSCKRLREAFRYSLIGTWCENLFGGEDGKTVSLSIDTENFKCANVKYLIYAFMLSSCSTLNSIKNLNGKDNTHVFNLKIDPTAFIVNSYAFDHRMRKPFLKYNDNTEARNIINYIKDISDIDILTKQDGEEKSLYDQIKEELNKSDYFPDFLLKHTDLSYNVIKRVMSEMVYSSDNNVSSIKKEVVENPFYTIKNFYTKLSVKLEDQDKGYLNTSSKYKSFKDKFRKNPVVSMFLDNDEDFLKNMGIEFKTSDAEEKTNEQTPA